LGQTHGLESPCHVPEARKRGMGFPAHVRSPAAAARLDHAITAGQAAGLDPVLVLINDQKFTETANCWGVNNNAKGTNTNRVVLLQKSNLSGIGA
jgi:hypothetical protein